VVDPVEERLQVYVHHHATTRLHVRLCGQYDAASGWRVPVRRLDFANADVAGHISGVWHSAGRSRAGTLDMQGQLTRATLARLARYLPVAVNAGVRHWLADALTGKADGVAVTVRGDLADFPFVASRGALAGSSPGQFPPGQFRIAGSFRDTALDYLPAQGQDKGWPRLSALQGTLDIERASLRLRAHSGQLHSGPDNTIALGRVSADIADLTDKATLTVAGDTSGQAADYLALMAYSPLGDLLDHHFAQTDADGQWRVPLTLTVPLQGHAPVQVQGRIEFNQTSLALHPDIPRITQLSGALAFSERGIAADGLRGLWLGGPLRITGELAPGSAGLRLAGSVSAEALRQTWPMPALRRIAGQTDYSARLVWQADDALDVHLQSSLAGLALDFPAPLQKPAPLTLPLTASWEPGRRLALRLGERVDAWLAMVPPRDDTPDNATENTAAYFSHGRIGVGQQADADTPQRDGLTLNLRWPELDVPAWRAVFDEFTLPGAPAARPWLPLLARIDVTSPQLRLPFVTLTDATLAIDIGADPGAPSVWRAAMHSVEASGDWAWQPPSPHAPGQFAGRFTHLRWGRAKAPADSPAGDDETDETDDGGDDDLAADAVLDFPDVRLSADQFSLYGRDLGALTLAGANVERERLWRVTDLTLSNPDATLQGAGLWRLVDGVPEKSNPACEGDCPDTAEAAEAAEAAPESQTAAPRGLTLEASLAVHDLGRLMARLGVPDRVAAGSGTATATLVWRNLPWQRRDADLAGQISVALEKGVLLRASSFSARLLELLSLQSLSRLSRLDIRPDAIFRDGVRFDTIRAELALTGSRIRSEGIKVDSPVAAILLEGDTDWRSERWNLQAAVVPKLDASGAAIAAGIIVNPLVGVGALLAQWLLKEPLANAMTARYTVTGTWDEPEITAINMPRTTDTEHVTP